MKKFGLMLLMSAVMLACMLPMTTCAAFPILIGIPSTISSGSIWLAVGILVVAIIAAVAIIVKVKKNKK